MVRLCVLKWIKIQNLLRAKSTYKRIMDVYQSGLDNDVSEICLGNEKFHLYAFKILYKIPDILFVLSINVFFNLFIRL